MNNISPQRVLIIDNDSDTRDELLAWCCDQGWDATVVQATAVVPDMSTAFDLTILSGGIWYDDEVKQRSTYARELELIRTAQKPVLGICLGMQLMQVAFSGEVPLLATAQSGQSAITLNPAGQAVTGLPATLLVHKNHTRGIRNVEPGFRMLAYSEDRAEIIQHTSRPLLGVQFHPELGAEPAKSALFHVSTRTVMAMQK